MAKKVIINVNPDFDEYKKAAERWERTLIKVPVLAAKDTTQYMTGYAGCRTNQHVGTTESKAQFYPYAADKRGDAYTKIDFETLEIYFGSMIHDFVPNDMVQTILAEHADVIGMGQSKSEIAKLVIASIMESAGEELAMAIPVAVRDDHGYTTMDLFNGHVTLINKAINDNKVSVAKKNLVRLSSPITVNNVVDVLKKIEFGLDRRLRKQERFLYCDPALLDLYNEGYLLSHPATPYNDKYEQPYVEGSNKKLTFAPLDGLAGTGVMWIAPKKNVIYGYDNMGDTEKCEILRFNADTFTLNAKMFFGAGFRTFDFRFLKVIIGRVVLDTDADPGQGDPDPDDNGGVDPEPAGDAPTITETNVSLTVGSTATLTKSPATGWTFESEDETIATVDEDGVITGVADGSTTISCYHDDLEESIEVGVLVSPAVGEPRT